MISSLEDDLVKVFFCCRKTAKTIYFMHKHFAILAVPFFML